MTFYEDSRTKYPDEIVLWTIQHKVSGRHLFETDKHGKHWNYIAFLKLSEMSQRIHNDCKYIKTHTKYRDAKRKIDKMLDGYEVYEHRLRIDCPENKDIIRKEDIFSDDAVTGRRIKYFRITAEIFDSLYKFSTIHLSEIDPLEIGRRWLFDNYYQSAVNQKFWPIAGSHAITHRQQFIKMGQWKSAYMIECNLYEGKMALDIIQGNHQIIDTLSKMPAMVVCVEDQRDANAIMLVTKEAKITDISKSLVRLLNHGICQ